MSFNSPQEHTSPFSTSLLRVESWEAPFSSAGSSSLPMATAENEGIQAVDLEEDEEGDVEGDVIIAEVPPIESGNYMKRQRKKTSAVWQEFTVVTLPDGTEKVQCVHCKLKFAKQKDGTTTQYKRHLDGCIRRQMSLKGQGNIFVAPRTHGSESMGCVQTWKYD